MGTRTLLHYNGRSTEVTIPVPGVHQVTNALAAAAVGVILDLTDDEIKRGIESTKGLSGCSISWNVRMGTNGTGFFQVMFSAVDTPALIVRR